MEQDRGKNVFPFRGNNFARTRASRKHPVFNDRKRYLSKSCFGLLRHCTAVPGPRSGRGSRAPNARRFSGRKGHRMHGSIAHATGPGAPMNHGTQAGGPPGLTRCPIVGMTDPHGWRQLLRHDRHDSDPRSRCIHHAPPVACIGIECRISSGTRSHFHIQFSCFRRIPDRGVPAPRRDPGPSNPAQPPSQRAARTARRRCTGAAPVGTLQLRAGTGTFPTVFINIKSVALPLCPLEMRDRPEDRP